MFMGARSGDKQILEPEEFFFPVVKDLVADQELLGTNTTSTVARRSTWFCGSRDHVDPSYEFAPFQDYVNSQIQDELNAAVGGNGHIVGSLRPGAGHRSWPTPLTRAIP